MYLDQYPHCCNIWCLCDFAELDYDWGYNEQGIWGKLPAEREDIKTVIIKLVKETKIKQHAMLTAATTDKQKEANEALTELGFDRTEWKKKSHHRDTKVALWVMDIKEFYARHIDRRRK